MAKADEPRWLTEEQTEAWITLVGIVVWLPAALDAQLRRDAGISHVEYQVLSWLSMSPGRSSRMSTLADVANVNLSHLSRVAARLESRGWVRRSSDPEDGRVTMASLTHAGWDKVVATAPGHVEEVQRLIFDNLTDRQVHQLQQICSRVLHAVMPDYRTHLPSAMAKD